MKEGKIKLFLKIKAIINTILVIIILLYVSVIAIQKISGNRSVLGIRIYNIATSSMIPKYKVNDIILVKDIKPNELKVGDDVTYKGKEKELAGKLITHRIIDIKEENNKKIITTKGINNDLADPEIEESQVIGKVVCIIPVISFIHKLITTQVGFFIIIFCPIVLLVCLEIAETTLENKLEKDELVKQN